MHYAHPAASTTLPLPIATSNRSRGHHDSLPRIHSLHIEKKKPASSMVQSERRGGPVETTFGASK